MRKVKNKIKWIIIVLIVSMMMTQNYDLPIAKAENLSDYKAKEIIALGEYDDVAIFEDGTILVYQSHGEQKEVSSFDCTTKSITKIGDYIFDDWNCIQDSEQIIIKNQNKYGIMDKHGKIILACLYDEITYFSEGLAGVKKDGKAGFVDEAGKVIVPLEYDEVSQFSEGLAGVKKDGKSGYIDQNGNVVLPLKYDNVGNFSEDLGAVTIDGKVGYIDKAGNIIIPMEFNEGNQYSEDLAGVKKDGKLGFIDHTGNIIIPTEYDEVSQFSGGLARVTKDGKSGYINKIGKIVVELEYEDATDFNHDFAGVSKNKQYGIIDKLGNEIIELKYERIECKGNLIKAVKDKKVIVYDISKEQDVAEVDLSLQDKEIETKQDQEATNPIDTPEPFNTTDPEERVAMSATNELEVNYQTHSKNIGWQTSKINGEIAGTTGQALHVEAIAINLNNASGMGIRYSTHIQNIGWQAWKQNGQVAGTTGQGLQLEGIKIELTNAPKGYSIQYSAHVQDLGWQEWRSDGAIAGTTGASKRIEAIKIRIINKSGITYQTHIENYGWQDWKVDGDTAGTSGKALRLEGINIKLNNPQAASGIRYSTHIENIGWQEWKENGNLSGTSGQALRLEGIKIELINATSNYHVEYRVHVQDEGWQAWKRDGQIAGTSGQSKRLEAIEIKIVWGSQIKAFTVMLDPGHEGKYPLDSGAVKNGLYEYQLNNSLVKIIANKLESQGYKVIYTRNPNIEGPAPLKLRDETVNTTMPDLFISVHHDSSISTIANGYSIHYSTYRYNIDKSGLYVIVDGKEYPFISQSKRIVDGSEETFITYSMSGKNIEVNIDGNLVVKDRTPSIAAKNSEKFANILHSKLKALDYIGPRTNPVTDHNLYITRETNVPTVLFEAGFISNPTEANKIKNTTNQNKFADKVVLSINEYFK